MNASSSEHLSRSFEYACNLIRRSKEKIKDVSQIDFLKSFLCNRLRPWLLIFDDYNCHQLEDVRTYIPTTSCGAVVLINRNTTLLPPATGSTIRIPRLRIPGKRTDLSKNIRRAIIDEHVAEVDHWLQLGANPSVRSTDNEESSYLDLAIMFGNSDIAKLLLEAGAEIRPVLSYSAWETKDGPSSPLYYAACKGLVPVVQMLLKIEDDNESTVSAVGNNAALFAASRMGHHEIVRVLVEHTSVHIDGTNRKKETALGLAAHGGYSDTIQVLLAHGSNPSLESLESLESAGHMPVVWATRGGHLDVVRFLCSTGQVNIVTIFHSLTFSVHAPLEDFLRYIIDYRLQSDPLSLQQPARSGFDDIIGILSPPKSESAPSDQRSLGHALYASSIHGFGELVSLLLKYGADPNLKIREGTTVLQEAVSTKHQNIVSLLLQYGADPNSISSTGTTVLQVAVSTSHQNIVSLLLEYGADPNSKCRGGTTVLQEAIFTWDENMIILLLKRGANPNLSSQVGELPLQDAIGRQHPDMVSALLQYGANPYPSAKATLLYT